MSTSKFKPREEKQACGDLIWVVWWPFCYSSLHPSFPILARLLLQQTTNPRRERTCWSPTNHGTLAFRLCPHFFSIHLPRPQSTSTDHHPRPESHLHHHRSIRTLHPPAFANPLLHQHAFACHRYFHCHLLRSTSSHSHRQKVASFAQLFHLLHCHITPLPFHQQFT